jgi:hypothetical protein
MTLQTSKGKQSLLNFLFKKSNIFNNIVQAFHMVANGNTIQKVSKKIIILMIKLLVKKHTHNIF